VNKRLHHYASCSSPKSPAVASRNSLICPRPKYVASRQPRVRCLPWTNVFIPADVLGSNCTDVSDNAVPDADQIVEVAGMKPTRIVQFTDEKLTWSGIRARRGFLSHGDYWSVPGAGNCLGVVLSAVRAALTQPDTAPPAETPD
jgi:hypothetical protein